MAAALADLAGPGSFSAAGTSNGTCHEEDGLRRRLWGVRWESEAFASQPLTPESIVNLALAIALVVLSASADAPAASPASDAAKDSHVRAQVNAYLGSEEPATRERWRSLGPRALPFLAKVASDQDASPQRRAKAIRGIAAVGSASDTQMLLELAKTESQPLPVRIVALRTGAKLLPPKQRLATVRPMLKGARPVLVRAAAAEIMTRQFPKRECGVVQAQVDREKAKDRHLYQGAMRRCPEVVPRAAEGAAVPPPRDSPPPTGAPAPTPAATSGR